MSVEIRNCKIELAKYTRYRILDTEENTYLIDADSNKFTWLLPVGLWLFKHDAYVIEDKEKIETIRQNKNKKRIKDL